MCIALSHILKISIGPNIFTEPKTSIKMLLIMFNLRCNNRSHSFPKLSDFPAQSNPSDVKMFIYYIMNDVTKNF